MLVEVVVLLVILDTSLSTDLTYHVEEGQSPGTFVGDIAADSTLPQDYNLVTYSQLQKSEGPQLFNVSKTGKIYTAQTLDAEFLCKYNTECFEMVDIAVQNKQSFVEILEIKVIIEDDNDNNPEFPNKQINLEFSEIFTKGIKKSIPNAIDRDVGFLNSQITYDLKKNVNEPFTLSVSKRVDGSDKLQIILAEMLDREVKDIYMLQIIAKDGGSPPKHGVLNVQVSVTDENDNQPAFSQNTFTVSIKSSQERNTPIVRLSASDLDYGENGRLTYHFSSKTSDVAKTFFELNKTTGEVFLCEDFPFNRRHSYKLYIQAQDGGSPPMSATAFVLVNVNNKRNNAPRMKMNFFSKTTGKTATISEDIKVDSFIAFVKVVDNDIGQNGEVTCDINHDIVKLQSMGEKKYKVVVKYTVDRETKSHINFTVMCEDKGSPPLKTEKEFSFQVMDVNDVQPQFTKDNFEFQTYENREPTFPVGFINATDPDLGPGGQLTYSLYDDNKNVLPFEISNFGFITTTQTLDREQQEIYKFKVLVKDNGTPTLSNTANVIVEIMDKNDNAPYFTFPSVDPFSLDVHYHPHRNNDITVLRASDRDSHVNAFIIYEIFRGNDRQLFSVDIQSGVLSFARTVYQNDVGSYDLQIVVKDSGTPVLSATTTLSLTLTVSNKTAVMFTAVDRQSNYGIHINLMIIILVAAVIVSVAIVVSITLCIIRRNNHSDIQYRGGIDDNNKFIAGRTESEYVSQQMSPQYDGQVIMVTDPGNHRISQTTPLRTMPRSGYKSAYNWGNSPSETHLTLGRRIHQEPELISCRGEEIEQIVMAPDHFSEMSTMSSHDDSGHGWSEGNTVHYETLPGHKSNQLNMFQETTEKPLQQTLNRYKDTKSIITSQPNVQQNTHSNDVIDLKSFQVISTRPDISSQPWNLPMKHSFAPHSKPLPPIPKVPYS